jgi:hypothetical protein
MLFKRYISVFKNIFKEKLSRNNFDYKKYWQLRYSKGGDSGSGSYGILAEFKAKIINNFIDKHNIVSIIEFGCGDGNQLKFMNYKKYLGFDIAKNSIIRCHSLFKNDTSKSFILYDPKYFINNAFFKADLVVCLDVLYHIIPEWDFLKTLQDIFSCSSKYVILYTSIDAYKTETYKPPTHIFHRDILNYLSKYKEFKIEEIVKQKYKKLSSADFIILTKRVQNNEEVI